MHFVAEEADKSSSAQDDPVVNLPLFFLRTDTEALSK